MDPTDAWPPWPTVFCPNGVITHETCPECQGMDVKREHGTGAVYDRDTGRFVKTEIPVYMSHCPECGDSLVIVCT